MQEIFLVNQDHLSDALKDYGLIITAFEDRKLAIEGLHSREVAGTRQPVAVLCEYSISGSYKEIIHAARSLSPKVPVIVVSRITDSLAKKDAFEAGATDFFTYGLDLDQLAYRIRSVSDWDQKVNRKAVNMDYKLPTGKRVFDVIISILVITLLSPVFIVTGLLIKLTSRGPAFISLMRVGTGYTVFPLYQFRTSVVNAGKVSKNKLPGSKNKDTAGIEEAEADRAGPMLVGDNLYIAEEHYREKCQSESREAQEIGENDAETTRFGRFIRKTGIEQLPQFFNVLLGHMSIVGNRPLPLHIAEQLTSDEWTMRFLAPAGITGLWQLAKASEGYRPDLIYAEKYSFWLDLKILLNILDSNTRKSLEMN